MTDRTKPNLSDAIDLFYSTLGCNYRTVQRCAIWRCMVFKSQSQCLHRSLPSRLEAATRHFTAAAGPWVQLFHWRQRAPIRLRHDRRQLHHVCCRAARAGVAAPDTAAAAAACPAAAWPHRRRRRRAVAPQAGQRDLLHLLLHAQVLPQQGGGHQVGPLQGPPAGDGGARGETRGRRGHRAAWPLSRTGPQRHRPCHAGAVGRAAWAA